MPKEKPEKTKPAQPSQEKKGKQRKARIKVLTAGKGTSWSLGAARPNPADFVR